MRRTLTPKEIDQIFAAATNQADAVAELYKLAFPDWDKIASIKGWPTVGVELSKHIFRRFIAFDTEHHKGVMPGGLWMNKGFSTVDSEKRGIGPWELSTEWCEVSYTPDDSENSEPKE